MVNRPVLLKSLVHPQVHLCTAVVADMWSGYFDSGRVREEKTRKIFILPIVNNHKIQQKKLSYRNAKSRDSLAMAERGF